MQEYELETVNLAADRYRKGLENYGTQIKPPVIKEGFYSSWAQYSILLENEERRDSLQTFLSERGIPTMIYYRKPMSAQSAFGGMDCVKVDLAVSQSLCKRVLSLPLSPYITVEEQDRVIDEIGKWIGQRGIGEKNK